MAFNGAALAYEWPGTAYLMMGMVGIAGLAAIVGGGLYIFLTVGSLLVGPLDGGKVGNTFTDSPTAPTAAAQAYGSAGFVAPGTFVWRWFSSCPSSCTRSLTGSICRRSGVWLN